MRVESCFGNEFKQSAAARVQQEACEVRVRLFRETSTYSGLDGLTREGFTDYLMMPLKFMGGSTHSISFATKAPGAFSDDQVECIRAIVRPLSRVACGTCAASTSLRSRRPSSPPGSGGRSAPGRSRSSPGLLMWLISMPVQFAVRSRDELSWLDAVGASLVLVGVAFESIGDLQLARFKVRPESRGQLMTRRLWR